MTDVQVWGTMGNRAVATANCEHCSWSATHRADTVAEVADFLRRLIVAHCHEQHPERFPPEVRPC